MKAFLKCLLGPHLYRIHKIGNAPGRFYEANGLESVGDAIVKWMRYCWSATYWGSPALLIILYRRGSLNREGLNWFIPYAFAINIVIVTAFFIRGIGRFTNIDYRSFLAKLLAAKSNRTTTAKKQLARFDFDFSFWPIDFSATRQQHGRKRTVSREQEEAPRDVTFSQRLHSFIAYLAARTFGRRMVYPGSTGLVRLLMGPVLLQGRARLIDDKAGQRAKLRTQDGNDIDTMFIDQRSTENGPNANTLVICCEGNSGFYEVGCMVTPMEAGYSVLGWNHPGFAGSTGVPWPAQEQDAVDAVMSYARQVLGFQLQQISLFAWSIGGYAATWAAMTYPEVKQVILDATFDELLPLATARMPTSMQNIVSTTIKRYLNLNNAKQLCQYPGPVLLIRRSRDEMISTQDSDMSSNRTNHLLLKLISYRYPNIVGSDTVPYVEELLATEKTLQAELLAKYSVDTELCLRVLKKGAEEHSSTFPCRTGDGLSLSIRTQLSLFLATKYLEDYDSTHCTQLPSIYLRQPWNLGV